MAKHRINRVVVRRRSEVIRAIVWIWRFLTGAIKRDRIKALAQRRKEDKLTDNFNQLVRSPYIAEVTIGKRGRRIPALILKENHYTIWVELPNRKVIKRHKKKHCIYDGIVAKAKEIGKKLTYKEIMEI